MKPGVLLTRPEGENEALARMLESDGFSVTIRPLLEVTPVEISPSVKQIAIDIDQQDLLVFVSRNAVKHGMALIDAYWPELPSALAVCCVGPATAGALAEYGVTAEHPAVPGSEGLLELLPEERVADKRICIVRGEGGRELLATRLRERGAEVAYMECYRRRPLAPELPAVRKGGVQVVALTSVEILETFTRLCPDASRYVALVPSARVAELASGFAEVITAPAASSRALYDSILAISQGRNLPHE